MPKFRMAGGHSGRALMRAAGKRLLKEMGGVQTKRIKVKTLLKIAKMERRSEESMATLSQALYAAGITVIPGLLKVGDEWQTGLEDWLYLETSKAAQATTPPEHAPESRWQSDPWFDEIQSKTLRTEREVESKFIIPLLARLGYSEDDRYDEMPVHASNGSKQTVLRIDFALFSHGDEQLANQVLLTVEAKREERLLKSVEMQNAFQQAKCYAVWTGCRFCLVTDSKEIVLYQVGFSNTEKECERLRISRSSLKEDFPKLYSLCSKESLREYYLQLVAHAQDQKKAG